MAANACATFCTEKFTKCPRLICRHSLFLPPHYAPAKSSGLDREGIDKSNRTLTGYWGLTSLNTVVGQVRGKAAAANNKHIATIAALSRVDKFSVFSRRCSRWKCVEAATAAICRNVVSNSRTCATLKNDLIKKFLRVKTRKKLYLCSDVQNRLECLK